MKRYLMNLANFGELISLTCLFAVCTDFTQNTQRSLSFVLLFSQLQKALENMFNNRHPNKPPKVTLLIYKKKKKKTIGVSQKYPNLNFNLIISQFKKKKINNSFCSFVQFSHCFSCFLFLSQQHIEKTKENKESKVSYLFLQRQRQREIEKKKTKKERIMVFFLGVVFVCSV